jgi:hypothetical protein
LQYLISFSVWISFSLVAHLSFIGCLFFLGVLPVKKQANPIARPWAGLLLIPFALALGFLVRFVDAKTWVIRPASIYIRSTIKSDSIGLEQIDAILIEESDNFEVWTIRTTEGDESEFAVFLKTTHNEKIKRQLFESEQFDDLVARIAQLG